MNSFCECLTDDLCSKFDIGANFFVSKKKKIIHMSLKKTLNTLSVLQRNYIFYKKILGRKKIFLSTVHFMLPKAKSEHKVVI